MTPVEEGDLTRTKLTRRERQILICVLKGWTNKEIAASYGVREQTIKNQLTTLFEKAGVRNRVELAVYAMRHRLDRE